MEWARHRPGWTALGASVRGREIGGCGACEASRAALLLKHHSEHIYEVGLFSLSSGRARGGSPFSPPRGRPQLAPLGKLPKVSPHCVAAVAWVDAVFAPGHPVAADRRFSRSWMACGDRVSHLAVSSISCKISPVPDHGWIVLRTLADGSPTWSFGGEGDGGRGGGGVLQVLVTCASESGQT